MNRTLVTLIACHFLALLAQLKGSEMTASLASKVEKSDLVAIIKITEVDKGHIHMHDDWPSEVQDFTMRAEVLDRIRGRSSAMIVVSAYSTSHGSMFSTAGFSAYGIEPGQSYIAYLKQNGESRYELSWNSNQFLEEISPDGATVNDIGQVMDHVPLAPKLKTLRALARGGRAFAILTHPVSLTIAFGAAVAVLITVKRRKRRRQQAEPNEIQAQQGVTPNARQ